MIFDPIPLIKRLVYIILVRMTKIFAVKSANVQIKQKTGTNIYVIAKNMHFLYKNSQWKIYEMIIDR